MRVVLWFSLILLFLALCCSYAEEPLRFVVDGDSRTAAPASWFDLLCEEMRAAGANYAVPGKTVAQMLAGYETAGAPSFAVSGGHQCSPAVKGSPAVYFVWGATNDLGTGADARTVLNELQRLYAHAHADGYRRVVGFTETPRTGGGWGARAESERQALNAALRGLSVGLPDSPDLLIDADKLFPRDREFPDRLHLGPKQQHELAQHVRSALLSEDGPYPFAGTVRWAPEVAPRR